MTRSDYTEQWIDACKQYECWYDKPLSSEQALNLWWWPNVDSLRLSVCGIKQLKLFPNSVIRIKEWDVDIIQSGYNILCFNRLKCPWWWVTYRITLCGDTENAMMALCGRDNIECFMKNMGLDGK